MSSRQERRAVAFGQMRLQHEVRRQEAPRLRVPVHAAAADAVRRHERAPVADRQRGLVHLVAEREGRLVGPQKQFVADAIAQFVLRVVRRKFRRRVAPGAALDRDDVQPFVGQLVGHDRAGPAEPDDDDVFFWKLARHARLSLSASIRRGPHAHRRKREAFVVTFDPVEIIVARAGVADHFPRHHVAIAAINRVGEEALCTSLTALFEELLAVGALEFEVAAFKPLQHLHPCRRRRAPRTLAGVFCLAGLIERREAFAIICCSRLRTAALLPAALHEGRADVDALPDGHKVRRVGDRERPRNQRPCRPVFPDRRNDAVGDRLHRARFISGEEVPGSGLHTAQEGCRHSAPTVARP